MKKFNKNKLIRDIILGITKANSLRTLPQKWDNFHNHIIIRVIRVIAGIITVVGLINYNHEIINTYGYDIIIDKITLINFIYITSVSFTRLIYIIKIIYNKEYEVTNSPINRMASSLSNVWLCVKGVCTFVGTSGGILGGLAMYDNILERTGRFRVIMPYIENGVDRVLTKFGIDPMERTIYNMRSGNNEMREAIEEVNKSKENIIELQKVISCLSKDEQEILEHINNELKADLVDKFKDLEAENEQIKSKLNNNLNSGNNSDSSFQESFTRSPNEDDIFSKLYDLIAHPLEYVSNLSSLQYFAISILLAISVMLNSFIAYNLYLWNNHLIDKYDIKNKYPKVYYYVSLYRNISYVSALTSVLMFIISIILIIVICIWFIING